MKISTSLICCICISMLGYAQKDAKVLFICEHGAARSVIAVKYFEKLAKENGLRTTVTFRGISPDPVIGERAKEGLIKDGFVFTNEQPAALSEQDLIDSDLIVTLGCVLPDQFEGYRDKTIAYNGIPSISENYEVARDSIKNIVADVKLKVRAGQ